VQDGPIKKVDPVEAPVMTADGTKAVAADAVLRTTPSGVTVTLDNSTAKEAAKVPFWLVTLLQILAILSALQVTPRYVDLASHNFQFHTHR